jgi:hypothetical protein
MGKEPAFFCGILPPFGESSPHEETLGSAQLWEAVKCPPSVDEAWWDRDGGPQEVPDS